MTSSWLRAIIAGVTASVVLMVVEIVWHDTLFGAYYRSIPYITRPLPDFTAPTIGFILRGFLLSILFASLTKHGPSLGSGLRFGALIGLLTAIYWVPSFYAQHAIPSLVPWLLHEGSFFLIQGAAAGFIIATSYRIRNQPDTA